MIDVLTDELILRLVPEWGSDKAERLKLLHAVSDKERKAKLDKLLKLSAHKELGDTLLPNLAMLPPSPKSACEDGEITLGIVCFGRKPDGSARILYPLRQKLRESTEHLICTGATGTGKSTLILNVAIQLARHGIAVCIFDWHRSFRQLLSLDDPIAKDIRVYTVGRDIYPFKGNLFFSPPAGINRHLWLSIISGSPMEKSLLSGQGSGSLIIAEAERLITAYEEGKLQMLPNVEDIKKGLDKQFLKGRAGLWKDSSNRFLDTLLRPGIREVFSSREPHNIIEEIIDRPGITIIEMDMEFPNNLRILLQASILLHYLLTVLGRGEQSTLKHALILEEFHKLGSQSAIERQVGHDLLDVLFKEGRKFGIGVYASTQCASSISNEAMSNARTHIHFPTNTFKDVSAVNNALFLKPTESRYLNLLDSFEALAAVKRKTENCVIKTIPPPKMMRVSDEELMEHTKRW